VAQIIAHCIEGGLSLATTTQTVNHHCEAMDQDAITESAVYTAFSNLKPKMIRKLKKKGSTDPEVA
jgi:hypothetical protein